MIDPFARPSNLTPQQWKLRARVIQAHLDRFSIDELMRGGRVGEPPHLGVRGPHRRSYDPNQPRVPAGHPDGGQWTDDDRWTDHPLIGAQFAAARELPPIGPLGGRVYMVLKGVANHRSASLGQYALRSFRTSERHTVSMLEIDGRIFFGSNSRLPLYTSRDRAEADAMREVLLQKYPELFGSNIGEAPMDGLYHAETNVLLRAAREHGGSLAGRTLEVVTDEAMCPSCPIVLPKVGLELGNPTVTFIGPRGESRTMRDGKWD
jgi:hypothetical protein